VKTEEPIARRYHTGVLYKNSLWIFGGTGGGKEARNDLYELKLDSCKWEKIQLAGEPPERFAHVAVVHGDKMFVHGGNGGFGFLPKDDFFSFDIQSKTWAAINAPNKPSPRYHHSATISRGNIYLFGGCKNNKDFFSDLFVFNTENQSWTLLKPSAPEKLLPRAGTGMFALGSYLYIYGGHGGDGGYDQYHDMYFLDLDNPTQWVPIDLPEDKPKPPSGRPITCVTSSKFAYFFGGAESKKPVNTLMRFDPKDHSFTVIPIWLELDLANFGVSATNKGLEPVPRYGHCAVLNEADQTITVHAGSGSTYLADVIQISITD